MPIGLQIDATKIIRGVGGKAFPWDYNWLCRVCGAENRAFEDFCPCCQWKKETPEWARL